MTIGRRIAQTAPVWVVTILAAGCPAPAQLDTQRVAEGLDRPVYVTSTPTDSSRLFVVEQGGRIRIVSGGDVLDTPFLDVSSLVSPGFERGLLGLAFHPEYDANGFFFVYYTGLDGDSVLARYVVSSDPNVADPDNSVVFLTQDQPFSNHNGGMLSFRPGDGNNLYVSLGDGGVNGPENQAQDLTSRLGKILRFDVDLGAPAKAPKENPNPFADGPGGNEDLIWVSGLRNPWRFSFDRESGDMYIGDVGESNREEVDFQSTASGGGENFGWDLLEGTLDFRCNDCDSDRSRTVPPIHEYGRADGFSVIGGFVYRGSAIPGLQGHYVFCDWGGKMWSFTYDGSALSNFRNRTAGLNRLGTFITAFGEDADGELYFARDNGFIEKIVARDEESEGEGAGEGESLAEGHGEGEGGLGSGCAVGLLHNNSSRVPVDDSAALLLAMALLACLQKKQPRNGRRGATTVARKIIS